MDTRYKRRYLTSQPAAPSADTYLQPILTSRGRFGGVGDQNQQDSDQEALEGLVKGRCAAAGVGHATLLRGEEAGGQGRTDIDWQSGGCRVRGRGVDARGAEALPIALDRSRRGGLKRRASGGRQKPAVGRPLAATYLHARDARCCQLWRKTTIQVVSEWPRRQSMSSRQQPARRRLAGTSDEPGFFIVCLLEPKPRESRGRGRRSGELRRPRQQRRDAGRQRAARGLHR